MTATYVRQLPQYILNNAAALEVYSAKGVTQAAAANALGGQQPGTIWYGQQFVNDAGSVSGTSLRYQLYDSTTYGVITTNNPSVFSGYDLQTSLANQKNDTFRIAEFNPGIHRGVGFYFGDSIMYSKVNPDPLSGASWTQLVVGSGNAYYTQDNGDWTNQPQHCWQQRYYAKNSFMIINQSGPGRYAYSIPGQSYNAAGTSTPAFDQSLGFIQGLEFSSVQKAVFFFAYGANDWSWVGGLGALGKAVDGGLTWSGGTVTAVMTATGNATNMPAGLTFDVVISGATPTGYNGTFTATMTVTNSTFTYPLVSNPGVQTGTTSPHWVGAGSGPYLYGSPTSGPSFTVNTNADAPSGNALQFSTSALNAANPNAGGNIGGFQITGTNISQAPGGTPLAPAPTTNTYVLSAATSGANTIVRVSNNVLADVPNGTTITFIPTNFIDCYVRPTIQQVRALYPGSNVKIGFATPIARGQQFGGYGNTEASNFSTYLVANRVALGVDVIADTRTIQAPNGNTPYTTVGANSGLSKTTNADSPPGNTLNFASTTGIQIGWFASHPNIPVGLTVSGTGPTTVTLSGTFSLDIPTSSSVTFSTYDPTYYNTDQTHPTPAGSILLGGGGTSPPPGGTWADAVLRALSV